MDSDGSRYFEISRHAAAASCCSDQPIMYFISNKLMESITEKVHTMNIVFAFDLREVFDVPTHPRFWRLGRVSAEMA